MFKADNYGRFPWKQSWRLPQLLSTRKPVLRYHPCISSNLHTSEMRANLEPLPSINISNKLGLHKYFLHHVAQNHFHKPNLSTYSPLRQLMSLSHSMISPRYWHFAVCDAIFKQYFIPHGSTSRTTSCIRHQDSNTSKRLLSFEFIGSSITNNHKHNNLYTKSTLCRLLASLPSQQKLIIPRHNIKHVVRNSDFRPYNPLKDQARMDRLSNNFIHRVCAVSNKLPSKHLPIKSKSEIPPYSVKKAVLFMIPKDGPYHTIKSFTN